MTLQKTFPILFLAVVALLLSACISTGGNPGQPQATTAVDPTAQPQAPAGGKSLAGTRWALVSMGMPGEETPVIDGSNVTVEFQDDGQVGGSGGCNSYGGQYQVEGSRIVFREVVSTLMACADQAVTGQESQYLQALGSANRFTVTDDQLSIYYDNDQSVLNFVSVSASSTAPRSTPAALSPGITDAGLIPTGPDEKQYTLPAQAGQAITLQVTSDGAPLSLTITSPSGIQRFPEVTQADGGYRIHHTFNASETGEYRLTLTKADHTPSTNYTAEFTVQ